MGIREAYIDIGKGIAMLMVIIGHCTLAPYTLVWWLYSFHMPFFFVLSGLTFNPDKYTYFIDFFRARFRSLLIPYFSLSFILWFWTMILQNKEGFLSAERTYTSFIGIFLGYRGTKYYFSMWFLLVLFVAELLLYAIIRKIKEKKMLLISIMIILSFIEWLLLYFYKGGFFWSLDLVPIALVFIMIGYLLKIYKEKLVWMYQKKLFFIVGLMNFILAYLNHRECDRVDLYYGTMGNYAYFMGAAIFGSWAVLIFARNAQKNRILEYVGRNSLVYYAFQNTLFIPGATEIVLSLGSIGGFMANKYMMFILVIIFTCIGLGIWSEIITKCFPVLLGKGSNARK